MPRSLTVKHEEKPATSGLLNTFLLLMFLFLVLTTFVDAAPVDARPQGDHPAPAAIVD